MMAERPRAAPLQAFVPGRPKDMTLGRVTAMATVAVLLTMTLGIGADQANATAASTGSNRTLRTSGWDSRIKPIADAVAKLRGLEFEHPVAVKFLSGAAFDKKVSVDEKLSKKDRAEIEHSEAHFRAIGLIASDVDLLDAINSFQTSGVLAFYSPKTKQVTVKGTDVDIATTVTLRARAHPHVAGPALRPHLADQGRAPYPFQ